MSAPTPTSAPVGDGGDLTILVTGFDPFGGDQVNASWEAVRRLPEQVAGAGLVTLQVPTSFRRSTDVVRRALRLHDPDVIVNVGQAEGQTGLGLERIAVNVDHARIADNDGQAPADRIIHHDGPTAYFSTLPTDAMYTAVADAGVDVTLSHTAGTFVCNHVFYDVAYLLDRDLRGKRSGFVHVPLLPEQVGDQPGAPSMELETTVAGLIAALGAIASGFAPAES